MNCSAIIRSVAIWSVACLYGSQVGNISVWCRPFSLFSKMTLLRTFPGTDRTLSLCSFYILADSFFWRFTRGPSFHSVSVSSRLDHAISLWRYPCRPWLPQQEFCLGRKLSLSSCVSDFPNICLSWSFAVYLEYIFSRCDV